jgi:hypothetical protein
MKKQSRLECLSKTSLSSLVEKNDSDFKVILRFYVMIDEEAK